MYFVKLRGLPWSCFKRDVVQFLTGCRIKQKEQIEEWEIEHDDTTLAIYFIQNQEGRPTGEAFVELCDEKDLELALKRHNQSIGNRYIEVFRSNKEHFEKHMHESVNNTKNWCSPVVRMRGLPFSCTKQNIIDFFAGIPLCYDKISMVIGFTGKFNGEAFAEFESMEHAYFALNQHKKQLANRYIEVFRSTKEAMRTYSTLSDSNKFCQRELNKRNVIKRKSSISSSSSSNYLIEAPIASLADYEPASMRYKRHKPHARDKTRDYISYIENGKTSPSSISKEIESPTNLTIKSEKVIPSMPLLDMGLKEPSNELNESKKNISNLNTLFGVKMRGLPYSANKNDVRNFFFPLQPVKIVLLMGRYGECVCYFNSNKEADEAMKYHNNYMSNRYIELLKMPFATLTSGNTSSSSKANFSTGNPTKDPRSNQPVFHDKESNVNEVSFSSGQHDQLTTSNQLSSIQLPKHLAERLSNQTPIKQECNNFENSLCDSVHSTHSTPNLTSSTKSNQFFKTHAPSNLTFDLHTNMNNKFFFDLFKFYCLQNNTASKTFECNKNN